MFFLPLLCVCVCIRVCVCVCACVSLCILVSILSISVDDPFRVGTRATALLRKFDELAPALEAYLCEYDTGAYVIQ